MFLLGEVFVCLCNFSWYIKRDNFSFVFIFDNYLSCLSSGKGVFVFFFLVFDEMKDFEVFEMDWFVYCFVNNWIVIIFYCKENCNCNIEIGI